MCTVREALVVHVLECVEYLSAVQLDLVQRTCCTLLGCNVLPQVGVTWLLHLVIEIVVENGR